MDWARDNVGLSDEDLEKVFKYEPKPTTVLKITESEGYRARIWSLESATDWTNWISEHVNSLSASERGLILILARRTSEAVHLQSGDVSIEEWLARAESQKTQSFNLRRAHTFAPFEEKRPVAAPSPAANNGAGNREPKVLPFSLRTFKEITESFRTHGSIARAMSRADVPLFSGENVMMKDPAYIYNCRTPNAWANDLALSATYLPASGLTFSILYGCTFQVEQTVMRRLQRVSYEAAHPLLLPGILAEVELSRHTKVVESMINKAEARILELNPTGERRRSEQETQKRNVDKRETWLDLRYMRNMIVSWNTQLGKMLDHTIELNEKLFVTQPGHSTCREGSTEWVPVARIAEDEQDVSAGHQYTAGKDCYGTTSPQFDTPLTASWYESVPWPPNCEILPDSAVDVKFPTKAKSSSPIKVQTPVKHCLQMRDVGDKIKRRIMAIRDEYDEKIRDCTVRVDGMAMATQWSHGETNVEIALATNRDSKVMRSIALVTMVFLPGTFFATVFSMTFFDWFGENGKTRVSKYLWIYILITLIFTIFTVGSWYFFVFYRQRYRVLKGDERHV